MSRNKLIEVLESTLRRTAGDCMTSDLFQRTEAFDHQPGTPEVITTPKKSQDVVLTYPGQRVAVLNFASAKRPGGGVRRGAVAQEEDLCRCSGLLWALEVCPEFYEGGTEPPEYTDRVIFTEGVRFIRDSSYALVKEPVTVSVITCAAPNRARVDAQTAERVLRARANQIVALASAKAVDVLILGLWGCGVFGNDPEMVVRAWKDAIAEYSGGIKKVVHPVYGQEHLSHLFEERE